MSTESEVAMCEGCPDPLVVMSPGLCIFC